MTNNIKYNLWRMGKPASVIYCSVLPRIGDIITLEGFNYRVDRVVHTIKNDNTESINVYI